MRILLIAYEFPPSPSPQSLRWTYLARELHALGHEVHVLTVDLGGETPGLPALPEGLHVHRTFAGLVRGALAFHREYRRRHPRPATPQAPPDGGTRAAGVTALRPPRNWKQRVSEVVQAVAARMHFPDIRGEWRPWGRRELRRLLDRHRFDVIVSSHEPATTLELALDVANRGIPWVADLGDPVLAPYTPRRWQRRARRIERAVCAKATGIIVTTEATATLLRERHGRNHGIHVLTQGFDRTPVLPAAGGVFDPGRLELLYTGTLYAFRRIDALLEAVAATPGVRLNIASVTVPEYVLAAASACPERIRLLGFLPHLSAMALQRRAGVLVNLANDDPVQIPGKFYESLGAGRPVLHLANHDDPVAARIRALRRGWVERHDAGAIAARLRALAQTHTEGRLDEGLRLDAADVDECSWQALARRLDAILRDAAARPA